MKKLISLLIISLCLVSTAFGASYISVLTLIDTPQDFTDSWVDLGDEFDCQHFKTIGLWLTIDINDSVNARVRTLAKHTKGGTEEYVMPIQTVSASDVKLEDEYFEFNVDADQSMLIPIQCANITPYIQIQISAGTVGATAGQIDAAYITPATLPSGWRP